MTVQELFKSLDRQQLVKEYLRYEDIDKDVSENIDINTKRDVVEKLLDQLISLDVEEDPNIIIFSSPILQSSKLDSYIIHREDLLKEERVQSYAYEFSPMKEVLGYTVSEACRYALSEIKFACSILYEMTFFGYEVAEQQEESESFVADIDQQVEEINSGKAALEPWENVRKSLGLEDTRSESEKVFDEKIFQLELDYNKSIVEALYSLERSYLNSTGEAVD